MSVIVILILASLAVALAFLAAFVWAVRAGQFDDTSTPGLRVLLEERLSADPDPGRNGGLSHTGRKSVAPAPGSPDGSVAARHPEPEP